jgi:starch synthase
MIEVLSVASEAYPLIKTGGLADVAGALPGAVSRHGVTMRTLIPGYRAVMKEAAAGRVVAELADLFDGPARLIAGRFAGLDLIVIDAPHLYDRAGGP